MLVKDYMTRHPILIPPETAATEAQRLMTENNIRHLPVVGDGKKLLGLVTGQRLALKPDALGSLNVWEITRYVSDLKVGQLMLEADEVHTIAPDRTIERAARIMAEHKIGCLPVIEENVVVGILSEVDMLRCLQDMLGFAMEGVRVTMRMPDQEGEFAKLTTFIANEGWGITGIGGFPTPRRPGYYDVVLKICQVTTDQVRDRLGQVDGQEVVDVRSVV